MGVEFDWLLGQMPDTLSGGQKQRVAIARCIVRDPNIFLMDEPIVNLDAKLRERTRIEIKKLLRQFGITTVYVTHDQQEAIFMGDRIAVMRKGNLEQVGTFDDLYYSPSNLFVAQFIGTPPIAIIPAVVTNGEIAIENRRWPLDVPLPDGAVRVGIRPEGWRLDTNDGISMSVRHIERIPTERASFVIGTIAGAHTSILAPIDYLARDVVQVTPDWEQALFFEAEGEITLHTPGVPDLF
jgi:ABC-type sugar transport system ATPase subunit